MKIFKIDLFSMLISPLAAIIFGVYVANHNELSLRPFTLNLLAVFLGIPLSLLVGLKLKNKLNQNIICVAFIGLILMNASFFSTGINGIHRWVFAGNIPLDISMVIAPLMLYIISKSLGYNKFFAFILTTCNILILVLQPDAGQATAFGIAAYIIFLFDKSIPNLTCFFVFIIINTGIVLAWCQSDPLPAVEQVELIMELAFTMGILGISGTLLTISILLSPIFINLRKQSNKINYENSVLMIAFIAYFITQLVVTIFGNYPVPIIGAGAAPVLGWYLILSFIIVGKTDNIKPSIVC